jgi:phospholipase/carboxylesterase
MDISTLARLPASGAPELLFLLFHAAHSDAHSMTALAQRLGVEYPQSAVLCVDAPLNASAQADARCWFEVDDFSAATRALPGFIAMVRELQGRFSVGWERTALFGFAQGATMALEAVQAEPNLAGRVLAFASRHVSAPTQAPEDTTHHFFHGLKDAVQPHGPAIDSAQRLLALGGDVTADVLPGIGHELHPALIDKAIEQLRTFLPKKVWREAAAEAPLISRVASSDELGAD